MIGKIRKSSRRGVVTVEMAIATPILFLLLFASMEFCLANVQRHTADNAAYEAARRGIVPGASVVDVTETAEDIMSTVGANDVNVVVTPGVLTSDTDVITVSVEVPFARNGWISPFIFSESDSVTARCQLNREEY